MRGTTTQGQRPSRQRHVDNTTPHTTTQPTTTRDTRRDTAPHNKKKDTHVHAHVHVSVCICTCRCSCTCRCVTFCSVLTKKRSLEHVPSMMCTGNCAEVEELKLNTKCLLRQCWTLGTRVSTETCTELQRRWTRWPLSEEKRVIFTRKLREPHFCDWSPQHESRFLCFFESKHWSLLDRIRTRREQRCSLLEKAKKQKIERERAIGEYEAMLNSSPGKGIIDPGCAKMMMGSDTFKQYLDLLTSKERASVEKVREKNSFRFGDNETKTSHWSAAIPMNMGKHVCREKVAIILGHAPFFDLKAIPPTYGSSSGSGERASDAQ